MNAAFVTASLSREAGGLHFAVSRLAHGLCDHGLATSVHGLRDRFSDEDLPAWHPATCDLHDRKGPPALGYSPSLVTSLIASNPCLSHTHGIWQWPSAAVHSWHRRTGKPYVVSPHGMLDPWALANSRWKKRIAAAWYESAHLRDAACIHALCQSEADSIRAYGLKNPVCVIPNGVDLVEDREQGTGVRGQECIGSGSDLDFMRSQTGMAGAQRRQSGRKTLLFLGRLHPKKGLVNALRAWSKIRSQGSGVRGQDEWQFVVAGWDQGGHEAELTRLCDELGLAWADGRAGSTHPADLPPSARDEKETACGGPAAPDQVGRMRKSDPTVIFVGPAFGDAKDALLRRADAFILPSFSEGLPMSVLEAWSYRLPVLMTDHCNLPEGFAANAAIRIGTDAESITEGMRLILRSPTSDLRSLGLNGRSLVERHFTWPQVAAQMKEVYEWVLGGGPNPGCVRD